MCGSDGSSWPGTRPDSPGWLGRVRAQRLRRVLLWALRWALLPWWLRRRQLREVAHEVGAVLRVGPVHVRRVRDPQLVQELRVRDVPPPLGVIAAEMSKRGQCPALTVRQAPGPSHAALGRPEAPARPGQ